MFRLDSTATCVDTGLKPESLWSGVICHALGHTKKSGVALGSSTGSDSLHPSFFFDQDEQLIPISVDVLEHGQGVLS